MGKLPGTSHVSDAGPLGPGRDCPTRAGLLPGGGVPAFVGLVCCSLVAAPAQPSASTPHGVASTNAMGGDGPIDCGDRKQLFIDRGLFADSRDIALRMNPPVKRGIALLAERPWEKEIGFCVSIVDDGEEAKMWYLAQGAGNVLCYAVSRDGIVWEKPSLGLFEHHGTRDNNIVMPGVIETMVFLDPSAPPESRFKAIAQRYWPDPDKGGFYVHTSPDGIHWKVSEQRVLPIAADSANQAFYDPRLGKYVVYVRAWVRRDVDKGGEGLGRRRIGRIELDDVTVPWPVQMIEKPYHIWGEAKIPVLSSEVPTVFGYDEDDPARSDHYHPAAVLYSWADNAYFMFPSAYRHPTGLLDTQMAVSRDGVTWTRPSREPYVSLGTAEELDSGSIYMAAGIVRRGGRIFQYYGGYRGTHLWGSVDPKPDEPLAHIYRVEQRLDGFVSADAGPAGGEFTTPPLTFSGTRLVLNFNASAMGACKVEILDEEGQACPGFSLGECDELNGNYLERAVSWVGQTDLSSLHGRAVRLRFVMRACKLFAFQFR